MIIGIDAMGGDFAPLECVNSIFEIGGSTEELSFILFGERQALEPFRSKLEDCNVQVVETGQSILMHEHPAKAVLSKKDSSINVGMSFLQQDKIECFASFGNTGAMMVSSMYTIKTIGNIERPALSSVLPQIDGSTGVLLDIGANADVKPETLVRFAVLGTQYAKAVYGIENPRVGLLNIGEEKEKGNIVSSAAYPLLEKRDGVNFIGNIEGRHLFTNSADVVICDGFTGNIVVKTCEGFSQNLKGLGVNSDYLERFNHENYGGAPILGIKKPVIVGHGISKQKSFSNMIKLSQSVVESNLISNIENSLLSQTNN